MYSDDYPDDFDNIGSFRLRLWDQPTPRLSFVQQKAVVEQIEADREVDDYLDVLITYDDDVPSIPPPPAVTPESLESVEKVVSYSSSYLMLAFPSVQPATRIEYTELSAKITQEVLQQDFLDLPVVYLASENPQKICHIQLISRIERKQYAIVPISVDYTEIQGTSSQIVRAKAKYAGSIVRHQVVMAEDTVAYPDGHPFVCGIMLKQMITYHGVQYAYDLFSRFGRTLRVRSSISIFARDSEIGTYSSSILYDLVPPIRLTNCTIDEITSLNGTRLSEMTLLQLIQSVPRYYVMQQIHDDYGDDLCHFVARKYPDG